jgi:hypothetical protein
MTEATVYRNLEFLAGNGILLVSGVALGVACWPCRSFWRLSRSFSPTAQRRSYHSPSAPGH